MGMLVKGVWHDVWYDTSASGGAFVRQDASFRDRVTADGTSGFKAEPRRYHLYVSLACPWAHRTLIARALKGLEDVISVSVVNHFMGEQGWNFEPTEGSTPDHLHGAAFMHQVYTRAKPDYTGRVTVPVLWDRQSGRIVNNESPEILRMLNTEFDAFATRPCPDLYPEVHREQIDAWNERIYRTVNNGVYRAGFATTQEKYDEAVAELFATLDVIDEHLGRNRYLCDRHITEADWRLFPTLVRFDAVYHGHFKCNLRRLVDYGHLWDYARELYQTPGIAQTVNFTHIKHHYYRSHPGVNPTRIVPAGPSPEVSDWLAPHGREAIG
jgi:putative glutathione S-transferase